MFFREDAGFAKVTDACISERFLKQTGRKYHYLPEDEGRMKQVATLLRKAVYRDAFWQHLLVEEEAFDGERKAFTKVVITLGKGVDELQEEYVKDGRLWEGYAVQALSGEILMNAYLAYNDWVAENTPYHVARYYFPGSLEECPIELLPGLLRELSVPVGCNEGYCMTPKESVAFYALLTKDKKVRCQGICTGCGRRDCPNRMEGGRPVTYGYARIFGK